MVIQQWLSIKCRLYDVTNKTSLLPLSFAGFGFACSFLMTGASFSHSLLSDIFRLLFDLVTLEFSAGGLSVVLAASWVCKAAACNEQNAACNVLKS